MDRRIAHSRPFQALATNSTPAAEPPASSGATTVKGPAASEALVNQIEHVAGSVGWRAIVFHLSRLQRAHRAEKHLLIAANMLEDIVRQHFGRLFLLPNNDLVAVCKGIKAKTIQDAEETLRYLFNDDSFTRRTHDGAGFSSNFDLEREHVPCLAAIRKRSDAARPITPAAASAPKLSERPAREPAGAATEPARVAELLSAVSRVDLSPMLRRQTAWKMKGESIPEPHSEEIFISIKALREAIGPAFNLASDRQLFGYLSRLLDSHILSTLSWEHFSVGAPLSFNINLASLQSPEFAQFEKRRPSNWQGRVMLEFQLGDVWGDLPAFLQAGQQLKRNGYLRCLDGVVFSALPFINLRRLDVDFVKLLWDDGLLALGRSALQELYRLIADCGADRIIMTRCGREEALQIGRALGIQLFQGWAVNRVQAAPPKIGDAVEVRYPSNQTRPGVIREIRAEGVIVLLGGAEGQTSIIADPKRLKAEQPNRWRLALD